MSAESSQRPLHSQHPAPAAPSTPSAEPDRGATPPLQQDATPCNNISAQQQVIARYLLARNALTERQRNAAELLLQGLSDQEVAAQVGVDRTTIFRWRKTVAFARELDRQRKLRSERAAHQIQAMAVSALGILQRELASDDPKDRMRAVSMLLRFATPSRMAMPSAMEQLRLEQEEQGDYLIAYVEGKDPNDASPPADTGGDRDKDDEEYDDDLADGGS